MSSESKPQCSKCKRTFDTQKDLDVHLINIRNTADYPCSKCGTVFHTQKDLDVHLIHMTDAQDWIHIR